MDNVDMALKCQRIANTIIASKDKIRDGYSGAYTRRRGAQEDSKQRKKDQMLSHAHMFFGMTESWISGTIDPVLKKITSYSDLLAVLHSGFPRPPDDDCPINGWYRQEYAERKRKADKIGLTSKEVAEKARRLLNEYLIPASPEVIKERELQKKIDALRSANIPGFFPTPDPIIERMLELTDGTEGLTILEPGAGIGSICDMVLKLNPEANISVCEQQWSCAEILQDKGYDLIGRDIYELPVTSKHLFDLVLMNPPFENREDAKMIRHCFDNYLDDGGTLISVISNGPLFSSDKTSVAFRDWIEEKHGQIEKLPSDAFKMAFRGTGVQCSLVKIMKR